MSRTCLIWTSGTFILLVIESSVIGVTLTPCRRDGVSDVTAGEKTQFVCMNGGQVEWRLIVDNAATPFLLASCDGNACNPSDTYQKTFTASVQDAQPTLTINAVNSTQIYNTVQVVNGTLLCTPKKKESPVVCGLNYVSPPENVSCQAVNKSLSCVVGAVYSSRNIYTCHLLRFKNGTEKEIVESVTMVTSPTTDKITKSEVKVSGSCQFNTPLPSEGGYRFYVSVSPGGRHFLLKFRSIEKGIIGGDINKISFLINDREKNETVMEGDYVDLRCEADGSPPSEMSISNSDNSIVIQSNSSVVNYSFIARCKDTATYTCFSWNTFSSPSTTTTSLNVSLDVKCKPRHSSSLYLGDFGMTNKTVEMTFEVIAYPGPHRYKVWFKGPTKEASIVDVEDSAAVVACRPNERHRYLSSCSLKVFNRTSQTGGSYKIQVINELGDENFTVDVISVHDPDEQRMNYVAVYGGSTGAVIFTLSVLIFIVINKRGDNEDFSSDKGSVTRDMSETCLTWTAGTFILLYVTSSVAGVTLTPCGRDGVSDVTAGEKTQFVCMNGGQIEWRLIVDNVATPLLLASCDRNACNPSDAFEKTFIASVKDAQPTLTINAVNNTQIYNKVQIVNGTLLCTPKTKESSVVCGLNYVSLPENVSCQAVNKSLSCVVGAVYSSRNIYICHLLRFKNGTEKEILESVTMVTSPTTDKITKSEVKVSGSCQFNTPLPSKGGYTFYVSVSPGGRDFLLKFESIEKGIIGGDINKISFLINDREKNETVMEGDYVNLRCEADGLPASEMSISNGDNNTVITSNSSVVNYTFIARSEDTTMYTCFLGNKSFSPSSATTSLNVSLDVKCKPRHNSSNYLGNVNIDNTTVEMTFELISYPAPYKYNVWFAGPLNEVYHAHPHGLVMNVTCTPDQTRRYVARCILNIFNITSQSIGSYKIQVINEVGDENFTVDVTSMHIPDEPLTKSVTGGVIGAVLLIILTVLVLFVVNRRRKSGKDCKLENTCDTIYQNPWDTVPLTVRGLGPGWRTAPCSPDGAVDTGRWRNQDGLLYVSPSFNYREQYISPPHEPIKYSTVKEIQTQVHPS